MGQATTLIVGCGYLGRRVGRLLSDRGERVVGTTRRADRAAELAAWGVEAVVADVLDPDSMAHLPAADRALYCVGFDRSAGSSIRSVYVDGLRHALGRLRGRVGKLVHVSSTGVYGRDDGGWVVEDSPVDPRSESGRACLEAEGVVRSQDVDGAPPATILRYSGLYGPGRILRREALLRGEPIAGDPGKYLNLIHIDDAAAAAVVALDRGSPGGLYLASDDRPAPRSEFYALAAESLGAPAPRFEPHRPGSPGAGRDESNKRVSNRRIRAELGLRLIHPDITSGVPAAIAAGGVS
jgi:nucleoside-diphosphate-sugar epimerase